MSTTQQQPAGTFNAARPDPVENMKRGKEAFRHVVESHEDAPAAMSRASIGAIDFLYGHAGNGAPDWDGGEGIAHVIAKHPDAASKIPGVIAFGDVYDDEIEDGKYYVVKSRKLVVLRKRKGSNSYLVTGYEADNPDKVKGIRIRNKKIEDGQ